ncbi:glutamate-ammonia-ligase adenylyltransferase [Terrihabitans soli]|uniref:Bifunctional glutamine synthetase adenylyltransferase/adenylyl-removing enzyme n=1 Tax=Terrihabitans soli TaxID=708113 RepID=A0A6S6QSQ3_9HYPH|nr:bifunctional [glutamine synthetase] adenylyltransferase/[glutamine synthetase]-adenylyl-L-tyrosine phosphorylase [Terrihabitans soli]BCJ90302.1 glutamate-ammonia-ligase adenylyltransferase [Terrihabitans soli]
MTLLADIKTGPVATGDGQKKLADFLGGQGELASLVKTNSVAGELFAGIAEGSGFLWQLLTSDPVRAANLLNEAPEAARDRILGAVRSEHATDETELMRKLRKAKQEMALLTALADLGGVWDVPHVTQALSNLADAALSASLRFLLGAEITSGKYKGDASDPEKGSGLIVLAMGKHGARELNYSSDIDLIVFYEPMISPVAEGVEATPFFVRLVQRLTKIMQERTGGGYVFRTDLRLRPDPGSTQVAITTAAALSYYESVGQNWERAAMLKARPCAGDIPAGEAFLKELTPFIWRKHLDYAAIADIHAMKRQIHAHRGHGTIAIEGHNIKLGRGGIREVEFFVQTQQLVAGGRNPALRVRGTEEALAALNKQGWIDQAAENDLVIAYRFLRGIEHRLQMVADEQTHSLPLDPAAMERFAHFAGYETRDDLAAALQRTLERVQSHYVHLFEDAPALDVSAGSLVFTGDEDDPETLATLRNLGFADPVQASALIRGWHHGRVPATRSARARELLTELVPALLAAVGKTSDPNYALLVFDRVLGRLPAGVEFFAILRSNPDFLGLLADALGTAPHLAGTVARRPHVLDSVFEPAFFSRLPTDEELEQRLEHTLSEATDYEDLLNRARIFGQEQRVLIGMRVLSGMVGADRAGDAFARLADILLRRLHGVVEDELAKTHGRMPGGNSTVMAMGKLGGREMTAASDLDLILIYEHPEGDLQSDGERPLAPSQYYARLTQRLVAALSAPTSEGTLYEVDLRLRPSGRAGPLATRLAAFVTYQAAEAWTWEHMALTRGRAVSGSDDFRAIVETEIVRVLTQKSDRTKIATDVREMRTKLATEKGETNPWDIKFAKGGLVDLEFLAQFLQLVHAHEHKDLLNTSTFNVLESALRLSLIGTEDWEVLRGATQLQHNLTQILRLCLSGPFEPEKAGGGVKALLARAGNAPDFASLDADLRRVQNEVRAIFERLVSA